jgi:uncharacterized protein YcbK (DUF882 family)
MTPSRQRRTLLAGLAVLPVMGVTGAARAANTARKRALSFLHLHTDERLSLTYFEEGRYLPQALRRIHHLLRDFRTGDVHVIDPGLLDTLHALTGELGEGTFEVISGYRSPTTNRMLRKHSDGVARKSMHLQGRAIDVRLTGLSTARLRDAAIGLGRGGVGYYPGADFVHLDTGRARSWG